MGFLFGREGLAARDAALSQRTVQPVLHARLYTPTKINDKEKARGKPRAVLPTASTVCGASTVCSNQSRKTYAGLRQ